MFFVHFSHLWGAVSGHFGARRRAFEALVGLSRPFQSTIWPQMAEEGTQRAIFGDGPTRHSPQTQRGYTAFVHTKIFRVIGASGSHTGTMSFGKMEGDASDKGIAFMLQQDVADGPYSTQERKGMKQTTPSSLVA